MWVGLENPSPKEDIALLNAATSIPLGINGYTTDFWLDSCYPRLIAPNIFSLIKRKNWKIFNALTTPCGLDCLTSWLGSRLLNFLNLLNYG